jgi:hypothetical protein
MVDKSENILVEFDYNNITIVDPNKVIDSEGKIKDRNVKQEDLVMYANLECKVLPRTKLAIGVAANDQVRTISVAAINFLNPGNKGVLTNDYTDEITGKDTLSGNGVNQPKSEKISNPNKSDDYYLRQTIQSFGKPGSVDNGLLGITNIQIRQGLDFLPTITMELEDIKGRAMFEAGNNSPYAAFFNLPYPLFHLTIKGYYGKAVKLALMLQNFSSRYDTSSGNFKISLTFYTYKYTVLNEVLMGYLKAVPHMYSSRVKITPVSGGPSGTKVVENTVVELGYEKVKELYSEYKSKGLVPDDFPEITLNQLKERLDKFVSSILDKFTKLNMKPLDDVETYYDKLVQYEKDVYYTQDMTAPSWFYKYMDTETYLVSTKGEKIYTYKKEISPEKRYNAPSELNAIIEKYKTALGSNETVGDKGSYTINNQTKKQTIPNKINLKDTFEVVLKDGDIDIKETYRQRKNVKSATQQEYDSFEAELKSQGIFNALDVKTKNGNIEFIYSYFRFQGTDTSFIGLTDKMSKDLDGFRQQIQTDLTEALSKLLLDKGNNGIGFVPNIRNVLAVIFANGEAFLRLMDDIHERAWSKRDNKIRKDAIFDKNNSNASADNLTPGDTSTQPVYPWPQFIVATNGENGHGKYELRYPGEYAVLSKTKGHLYDVWPEIEFVEEFIKGFTLKDPETADPTTNFNEVTDVKRLSVNAIEFPISNVVFGNKEEVKYFYEIYERVYLSSNYSRLFRETSTSSDIDVLVQVISEIESLNISNSLSNQNPFIIQKLKQYAFNGNNFEIVLRAFSNDGMGLSWQNLERGIFNTSYIKNFVNNASFQFLSESSVKSPEGNPLVSLNNESKLVDYIAGKNTQSSFDLLDTYPFTRTNWDKSHLANGDSVSDAESSFKVGNVLTYNSNSKVITNFLGVTEPDSVKPFTNFLTKNITTPNVYNTDLKGFYLSRTNETQLLTEGNLKYLNYDGLVSGNQTVSMLNTPYFVNSIQEGVKNFRNNSDFPYVASAYLFINSLPLSTLKEKFKTYTGSGPTYSTEDLDYIFATLKKFGAIHKMPYAWLLKIGSVWHRYKTYVETGDDIINTSWSGFSYAKNYDPIGSSLSKIYTLTPSPEIGLVDIVLEKNSVLGLESATLINTGFYPKLINDFNVFYQGYEIIKENTQINGTCSILGTILTISSINVNDLQVGYVLSGNNIKPGTTIVSQTNGNINGVGTYTVSISQNRANGNFVISNAVYVGYKDSDIQDAFLSGLTMNYVSSAFIDLGEGFDPNNLRRTLRVIPWSVCVDTPDKISTYIFPSQGSFINQTKDECFNKEGNDYKLVYEVSGNTSMYDGSVRLFWAAPNYGYFDNSKVIKSSPTQYLKEILVDKETQENFSINGETSAYSDISEMFSVFDKSVLDLFETEFLNFSKSAYDYNSDNNNLNSVPSKKSLTNFQMLFRDLMKIPKVKGIDGEDTINKVWEQQMLNFNGKLDEFLNYNVVFKYGNPSGFDKRLFYTFSNLPIVDPYTWEKYKFATPNVLPPQTTLSNSKLLLPDVWTTLETYVGYSEIPELQYKNSGSYITDFFIDLNIGFTVDNVIQFAPIIKIYATQKLKDNTLNSGKFYKIMNDYLLSTNKFGRDVLTSLMLSLKNKLPDVSNSPETIVNTKLAGDQTKIETWETFKALNDKWIAGGDFKTKTLFEDVLLLDRASRNIGDKIFVDVLSLKNRLTNINEKTSMYTFVSTILTENNFQIMNLPSYVNFYNVQDAVKNSTPRPEGTLEFANTLFGTFMNVDYRNSSPKLVCFYAGKNSEQLAIKDNVDYRFRDDAFDLTRQGDNPLFENLVGKKDWDKSNKVVGFNVDIGPENQSMFHSFQVAQNPGLATMESLAVETEMSNISLAGGGATQNISLYNLYKNRSYSCTLFMMGNAMIQPTMYFNLRHVPMFSGPYMIQKVNHNIGPGSFETIIEGVRQPTAELPKIENYIQVLKQTLLKSIIQKIKDKKSQDALNGNDVISQKNRVSVDAKGNLNNEPENYSDCPPDKFYIQNKYELMSPENNEVNFKEVINTVNAYTTDKKLRYTVFATLYLASSRTSGLSAYGNNFANITLNQFWGDGISKQYFQIDNKGHYYCYNNRPYVIFRSLRNCVNMLISRWSQRMGSIKKIDKAEIAKFWILNENAATTRDSNVYDNYGTVDLIDVESKIEESMRIFDSTNL